MEGGDVNTMFVKATVTGPSGAVAGGSVVFFLAKGAVGARDVLQAPQTDEQGVSLLDVGGHVATDEQVREGVGNADTLFAEYSGRPATAEAGVLCPADGSVGFRPDIRTYEPAEIRATSPDQLINMLRAVGRVLQSDEPHRMSDGQSPCRTLVAVLDDVQRHDDWFDPAALERIGPEVFEDPRRSCVSAPLLSSVQVGKVADSLAGT